MATVADFVDDVQYRLNDSAGVRYTNASAAYYVQNALLDELRYLCFLPILNEFLLNSMVISSSEVAIHADGYVTPLPTALRIIGFTIEGVFSTRIWNEQIPPVININDPFHAPGTKNPAIYIKNKIAYVLPLKGFAVGYHKVTFHYIDPPATTTVIPEALQRPLIDGAAARLAFQFQELDLGAECRASAEKELAKILPAKEK